MRPGQPARHDYEYKRNGTANLFMVFEPLAGRRRVKVTDRRRAIDFAEIIRETVDCHPTADKNGMRGDVAQLVRDLKIPCSGSHRRS